MISASDRRGETLPQRVAELVDALRKPYGGCKSLNCVNFVQVRILSRWLNYKNTKTIKSRIMCYISIDVNIDDILSSMSFRDTQKLANKLYDNGYISDQLKEKIYGEEGLKSVHSFDFDGQVKKLIGNSWRLTKEDEETILRIANKLI